MPRRDRLSSRPLASVSLELSLGRTPPSRPGLSHTRPPLLTSAILSRLPAIALPSSFSPSPHPYMAAVSNRVTPRSMERWMALMTCCSSNDP